MHAGSGFKSQSVTCQRGDLGQSLSPSGINLLVVVPFLFCEDEMRNSRRQSAQHDTPSVQMFYLLSFFLFPLPSLIIIVVTML